jgi:acylphosphatase
MAARRFRIEGRVQGVWFRDSTRRQAQSLGLTGHAVNCDDGSVEVLACGGESALDALERWLHDGPPMAEVSNVRAEVADDEAPELFTIG